MLDTLRPAHLGDVNQTFNARFEFDKRTVIGKRNDLPFDARADREPFHSRRPRIRNQLFVAEADALFVTVEFEHLDLYALTDLENLVRILNAAPRHVGNVEQTVESAEIDECAIFGDVLDLSFDDDALFE